MKKFLFSALVLTLSLSALAQNTPETKKKKKDWSKVSLGNRANDHFMIQMGRLSWSGAPDSLNTRSWSKTLNVYVMFDWPFRTDYRFSVAAGVGLGTDHMFFNNRSIDVAGTTSTLVFHNLDSADHFKKYKLATSYLEVPVELRFSSNPEDPGKSWKFAIGAKAGILLDAHTKGKNLEDSLNRAVNGGDYVQKIRQKKFFNAQRIAITGRIGYGNLSLWGSYQLTTLIRDGRGPDIRPVTIGLTISGL